MSPAFHRSSHRIRLCLFSANVDLLDIFNKEISKHEYLVQGDTQRIKRYN
jgi:hypothetical protein